jgi:hypothetical protein
LVDPAAGSAHDESGQTTPTGTAPSGTRPAASEPDEAGTVEPAGPTGPIPPEADGAASSGVFPAADAAGVDPAGTDPAEVDSAEVDLAPGDPTRSVPTHPATHGDPAVTVAEQEQERTAPVEPAVAGTEDDPTAVLTTGATVTDPGDLAPWDPTRPMADLVAEPAAEPIADHPARGRAAVWPAAVVSVAAAAAVVLAHLLAALRVDRAVATVGEAQLAASVFAARRSDVLADVLPPSDLFAARQLAALEVLLPTAGIGVVDAARLACLAAGLVVALLLWPIQRRLGLAPAAAAAGVLVGGALPPVIAVYAGVTAAAPAALWLVVAALLVVGVRGLGAGLLAGVLVLVAVLTAPLLAAAVLALGAHAIADRSVLRVLPNSVRIGVAAALGLLALLATVAAVGDGPLAGVGGPLLGDLGAVGCALLGVVVLGVGWWRARWLRPLLSPAVLLLAVVLFVPGPSRAAAAVLVVPVLALGAGVLVDELVGRAWAAPAVLVAAVATVVAAVVPAGAAAVQPAPGMAALVGWARTELDPAWAVRADALDRAEFVAAGFPADRLRDGADPMATDGEVRVISDRPGPGTMRMSGCPGAELAAVEHGSGGVPTRICVAGPGADERTVRARIGSELAANPALTLSPAAARALRAGDVDARVMLLLTELSSGHRLEVVAFPAVAMDASGVPLRRVLVSTMDGIAVGDRLPEVGSLLGAQLPPLVPGVVEPAGGALLIGYPAPAPAGLLMP